jgi:hypothetical protein
MNCEEEILSLTLDDDRISLRSSERRRHIIIRCASLKQNRAK